MSCNPCSTKTSKNLDVKNKSSNCLTNLTIETSNKTVSNLEIENCSRKTYILKNKEPVTLLQVKNLRLVFSIFSVKDKFFFLNKNCVQNSFLKSIYFFKDISFLVIMNWHFETSKMIESHIFYGYQIKTKNEWKFCFATLLICFSSQFNILGKTLLIKINN